MKTLNADGEREPQPKGTNHTTDELGAGAGKQRDGVACRKQTHLSQRLWFAPGANRMTRYTVAVPSPTTTLAPPTFT